MARCDLCVKFDNCPWRSDPDAMCSAFAQRPMTNADRIRSMSDKELAEWIWWNDMPYFTGKFEVVEWLKEESK